VYIWETNEEKKNLLGVAKTKVLDSFQAHSSTVTCALFAPFSRRKSKLTEIQIVVTADSTGEIKVFENKPVSSVRTSS